MAVGNGLLNLDSKVTKLDGVYLFAKEFNDSVGDEKLAGVGSLLGFGDIGFARNYHSPLGPAEKWNYDAKYVDLFRNLLARPKFLWSELSPQ